MVRSVWTVMERQARKHPEIGLLHEHLEGTLRLVGLTGGIASGKSTVAACFRDLKIPVIDADKIAREVVRPRKKAWREVVTAFGEGILSPDNSIDRKRLGEIVFKDETKRRLLESITHPEIVREILRQAQDLKKKGKALAVVDAALLFESGLDRRMFRNILVRLHPDIQLKRLMERDKLTEAEAWQRILSQMSADEKTQRASDIIDNSGSPADTRRQAEALVKNLLR